MRQVARYSLGTKERDALEREDLTGGPRKCGKLCLHLQSRDLASHGIKGRERRR